VDAIWLANNGGWQVERNSSGMDPKLANASVNPYTPGTASIAEGSPTSVACCRSWPLWPPADSAQRAPIAAPRRLRYPAPDRGAAGSKGRISMQRSTRLCASCLRELVCGQSGSAASVVAGSWAAEREGVRLAAHSPPPPPACCRRSVSGKIVSRLDVLRGQPLVIRQAAGPVPDRHHGRAGRWYSGVG